MTADTPRRDPCEPKPADPGDPHAFLLANLRVCSCCRRELDKHAFARKQSRHGNGKFVYTRQCRRCLKDARKGRPAAVRSRAYLGAVKAQPCMRCGQVVHPDAVVFIRPKTERYPPTTLINLVSFERFKRVLDACERVCANCWHIQRVARRRATKRNPVQVVRVDTSGLRAALNAQEQAPALADVPPAPRPLEIPPCPTPHRLTDSERQGREGPAEVSGR